MKPLSLRKRSFVAAFITLVLFVPLTVLTLQQAFTNSLRHAEVEKLRVQSLTLISAFELLEGDMLVSMPEVMLNEQLNMPGSGLYAFVQHDNQLLWQSLSAFDWDPIPLTPPTTGNESFDIVTAGKKSYFVYSYTAEFPHAKGFVPVSFYVVQDTHTFEQERNQFALTLWYWIALVAVILLALMSFSLNAALKPIGRFIRQIKRAENGEIAQIEEHYPAELEKLKTSLNLLLESERNQRERYKNSLSDLAHSLKTPLAVLASNQQLPEEARAPLAQLDSIIQRQLKRAVSDSSGQWRQGEALAPVLRQLTQAMEKIYRDKGLDMRCQVDENHLFYADKTDMMEMLGNILDNACKAAKTKVSVQVTDQPGWLHIRIDDDGPGINAEQKIRLLERGIRLDSYQEGQGIGMAIVTDLLASYQGKLEIDTDSGPGASIRMSLPTPLSTRR